MSSSLRHLATLHDISHSTLRRKILELRTRNNDPRDLKQHPPTPTEADIALRPAPIIVHGHEYPSHRAVSAAFGVPDRTYRYLLSTGQTPSQITAIPEDFNPHAPVICGDHEYRDLYTFAAAQGVADYSKLYWVASRGCLSQAAVEEVASSQVTYEAMEPTQLSKLFRVPVEAIERHRATGLSVHEAVAAARAEYRPNKYDLLPPPTTHVAETLLLRKVVRHNGSRCGLCGDQPEAIEDFVVEPPLGRRKHGDPSEYRIWCGSCALDPHRKGA